MTGKAAQQRVFGNEAKVAAGGVGENVIRAGPCHGPPVIWEKGRNRGLRERVGGQRNVGHVTSRLRGAFLGPSLAIY